MSLFLYSIQVGINIHMVTFKEYYQGDNMMNAGAVSATTGGKSIMRTGRKHENLKRKEHSHTCPHVKNLINGGASQIKLMGMPLQQTLDIYGMDFAPGKTNGCGNSGVEVQMFEDEEGNQCGMLRRKAK
jgi:hypothetical protein